jgi:hypothetical protein
MLSMDKYHDEKVLPWVVKAYCVRGWQTIATFATEASAWDYGKKHIDVRVSKNGECIGHKDGYNQPFRACDGNCDKIPEGL